MTAGLMVAVVLAGCSGEDPQPRPSEPTESAESGLAEGEPDMGALTSFTCQADEEGQWSATGVIANGEETSESYQVTVLVADSDAGNAKSTLLDQVQPGESATFDIAEIPPNGEEPTCRVTVIRIATGAS
ncbi:hypothetical protein [Aeromicrobium piscarium]|uniref:Uncharacterized protein n=1 Tax=Aeromicrobium piscarium TaxID=2590901 RepID=A0A554S855_9ACTN|nr:hypothetical protein [Aeromicrobium piscarium]TSD62550.1 hypothetical protein FNM00_11380 [Aeromicrobium piscarium]